MPSNFGDGYKDAQLYDFLSNYKLTRDPGAKYDYSNLGVGLLGHVLALKAGMDYDTLLRTRITRPLNMNDTAMVPTPEMQQNLAPGHDDRLRPAPGLIMEVMAFAGAIRSNADDMLTFLAANMGFTKTPLEPAMKKMLKVRKEASSGVEIGLGWHVILSSPEMVCHNGGTNGYHAFLGYEPRRKVGVVVLTNSTNSTDDLARRILDYRVTFPAVRRTASDDAY
jgi:CubicO group peptidase (beta-lactamase class C family)